MSHWNAPSFILLHISFIFSSYFFKFLHISLIFPSCFLHISFVFSLYIYSVWARKEEEEGLISRKFIRDIFLHNISFIFTSHFFIFLQNLGPEGEEGGTDFKGGPRKFNIHPRGQARKFFKSHVGLLLLGSSHTYLHDSHFTSIDSGSYFFIFV